MAAEKKYLKIGKQETIAGSIALVGLFIFYILVAFIWGILMGSGYNARDKCEPNSYIGKLSPSFYWGCKLAKPWDRNRLQ